MHSPEVHKSSYFSVIRIAVLVLMLSIMGSIIWYKNFYESQVAIIPVATERPLSPAKYVSHPMVRQTLTSQHSPTVGSTLLGLFSSFLFGGLTQQ